MNAAQAAVLAILREAPRSDLQVQRLWRYVEGAPAVSPQRMRTARAELVRAGMVQAAGRVRLPHGTTAAVWSLTNEGRDAAEPNKGGTDD